MLSELLSDTSLLPKSVKMSLMHINQRLNRIGIIKVPYQQTQSAKPEQFVEKVKFRNTIKQKHKSLSGVAADFSTIRKESSSASRQLLQLPLNIRSQSCSVERGYVGSLLLKQKHSTRFHSKLPRVSFIQQTITENKSQSTRPCHRLIDNLLSPTEFQIESKAIKAIDIRNSNLLPNVTITARTHQRITMKPPLPEGSPHPHHASTLHRLTLFKQDFKKGIKDILETRDTLHVPQTTEKQVVPQKNQKPHPKYKKGYLIYDQNCHSRIKIKAQKHHIQYPQICSPPVSAKLFCVLDSQTLKFIHINQTKQFVEIASLTKIVTCLLTILACTKYEIDIQTYKCRVSEQSSSMIGTSAELQTGDILTIQELLYGLMLPSGNDAAVALSQCMGRIIQRKKKMLNPPHPSLTFIKQMNVLYRESIFSQTQKYHHMFRNPSGLLLNPNITTVQQITLFAAVASKNEMFAKITNTKSFDITIFNQRYGISRKMIWRNTNKLLQKDWNGIKTGTTQNAGHCFIGKHGNYIYSLLNCETLDKRFTDAQILKNAFSGDGIFQDQ